MEGRIDAYDVVWSTPSRDASGSMPIGNGEVGANVWVEPDGRLCGYVSRTDSWSEASRLLKLGKFELQVRQPEPGEHFEQRLALREGAIHVAWGVGERRVAVRVFVDSAGDVLHLEGESETPEAMALRLVTWRLADRRLLGEELKSSWTMQGAPETIAVVESGDRAVQVDAQPARLGFVHRNVGSVVPVTLAQQSLPAVAPEQDLLRQRAFGLVASGVEATRGSSRDGREVVLTTPPRKRFAFHIAAPCVVDPDEAAFANTARALLAAADSAVARERTAAWWRALHRRSWILVDGDPTGAGATNSQQVPRAGADGAAADALPASLLTRALLLQRHVQAAGGRGRFPIKFNGSIFTVEPSHTGGPACDADWRRWGDGYWWQNTRLPYHAMLPQGDVEMLEPLFALYERALPLAQTRARLWHGVGGAFFPETMTPFGTHANQDYGWDRTGHVPKDVLCPWWCFAWNQGPELVALMLDRHDYVPDPQFVRTRLLPMASAVLDWFIERFPRDARGTLQLTPTQSVETYWHGVVNDLPTIAGLREVLARLLSLPPELVDAERRERWTQFAAALPPIPRRGTAAGAVLAPAERYEDRRSNCENPELYAVWPFRHFGLGRPELELAQRTFAQRHERMTHGWTQDGQQAALLGLVDAAASNLLAKVGNTHHGHRFPAMWGPNFDWLPDQCHGSNLLVTAQCMLLQPVGERLLVLPSWPPQWDVAFRLHAPGRSVVEVHYAGGKLERLEVEPAARRAGVALPPFLAAEAQRLGVAHW